MFVTMVVAALIVDGLFSLLGPIPTGPRPSRTDIFGSVEVDYKLFLNLFGLAVFATFLWLSRSRGGGEHVSQRGPRLPRLSRGEARGKGV